MTLTEKQIEYIDTNLRFYGIKSEELRNDVIDHICTHIENSKTTDFDIAYKDAIQKFGGYAAMLLIEKETYALTVQTKDIVRIKFLYSLGFLSLFFIIIGALFKIMHWPGASIMLLSGLACLAFIFLPLFFYHKYKSAVKRISS